MYRCPVCSAMSQRVGECGVCGGVVREIQVNSPAERANQKFPRFWTRAKILALSALILVSISSVGTGLYLSARPDHSCKNGAVNYPSCKNCGPLAAYSASTDTCSCTNYIVTNHPGRTESAALNPPACNKFCANNAINPPGCDLCAGNRTDVICPPANSKPPLAPTNSFLTQYSHT
jgi:hypothetical protein